MKRLISMIALLTIVVIAQADVVNVGGFKITNGGDGGAVVVSLHVLGEPKKPVRVFIGTFADKYHIKQTTIMVEADEARKIAALLIEAADLIDDAPSREALRRGHESIGEIVND